MTGLTGGQKGQGAISPPRKMTLALDNGIQRPITGLQIGSLSTEPVRRVAHLIGVLLHAPYPDARTVCSRRKRPSRTPCLTAISMPKRKYLIINIIKVFSTIPPLKNGEPARSGSIIWEMRACGFLFPVDCSLPLSIDHPPYLSYNRA